MMDYRVCFEPRGTVLQEAGSMDGTVGIVATYQYQF